jgi:hypothetical protein
VESFSGQFRFLFSLHFQIVEELQKHDPSEKRQPVKIAIQPFVFAHDVAGGLYQSA